MSEHDAQRAKCGDHDNLLLVICPDCGYEPPWADEMAEIVGTE